MHTKAEPREGGVHGNLCCRCRAAIELVRCGQAFIAGNEALRQKASTIVPTVTVDRFLAGLGVQ